ncbi:MAG: MG2 domain-containing protein, partial [Abditibacteriales bacterium]|nr:MG2 domain-containing protein [Abditibacteriales bacterium]
MSRRLARNDDVHRMDGFTRRDFIRWSVAAAAVAGIGGHEMSKKAWAQNEFLPSPLETRILGANTILAGSKASLRIVTLDHRDGTPVKGAGVRVSLVTPDQKERTLFKGYTNKRGTVDANFDVPKLDKGNYEVVINTSSSIGTDSFRTTVTVTEAAQVLLTTDKPLYQPNQTIHLRALALARPDLKPVAEKPLTFEVEDSKGNKVFKQQVTTSKFGVAAAEFVLGHEINLGRYTVRAVLDDVINEKKVTVDKYVLPKFKVSVTTDKKYYLPAETLKGTVQVDYFFGKPVAGGEVTVRLAKFDVGFHDFAEIKGTTDASGTYKFETKLPDSFVGLPLEQGNALVKLDVSVIDKAEHREKVTTTVPVAKDAIKITVVPESGALIPGVENTIYVLTNYPDGAPAQCRFNLKSKGIDLSGSTDKVGIGEVRLTPKAEPQKADATGAGGAPLPPGAGRRIRGGFVADDVVQAAPSQPEGPPLEVTVTAQDAQGNKGSTTTQIARRVTDESLLLRADKAIAQVGEALTLELISTRQSGTAYVDLVKDKQTVLTQSVDMNKGRGTLRVTLDETLSGTVQAHAYLITPRGDIVRDTKIVYVNPANDLKIKVTSDQSSVTSRDHYRPGEAAKITLSVTDERGHPVLAALGIQIVDESVFALQEMQPGMEKVYFTLEKELLEPKVEVHGFTREGIVPLAEETPRLNPEKQKVARVLFAAAQPVVEFGINHNSYQAKQQAVAQKWLERVAKDATKFGKALDAYRKRHGKFPAFEEAVNELLDAKLLTREDLKDPLGTPYEIRPRFGAKDFNNGFLFISAGIDKKMNTEDDVRVAGYPGGQAGPVWGTLVRRQRRGGGVELEFQEMGLMMRAVPAAPGMPGMGGAAAEMFAMRADRAE